MVTTGNAFQNKNDDELTIQEYWARHKKKIATKRHWEDITLNSYDRMMTNKLGPELPDKPISEVTFFDLTMAVDGVRYKARGGKPYKETSLNGFYALLGDIYKYAKDQGHADNILLFLQDRNRKKGLLASDFFAPSLSTEELQEKAREMVRENPGKVKSLTKQQMFTLHRIILGGLTIDGRYIALAIMLYCGLRPSECRGLTWGDIRPFRDHPDRRMFVLSKTRDPQGHLRNKKMKTANAYRYMPIHYELDQLLQKRYEYVASRCQATGEKIEDLPICCLENRLSTSCKDYQFSSFGADMLNQLRIPRNELILYMAHMITEDDKDKESSHLSLYVLRRNFCSWIQGETLMDPMRRSYVMGHTMWEGKKDLRQRYNGEDSLWEMLQRMDRAVLNGNYKRPPYYHVLSPNSPTINLSDQGVAIIDISQLPAGGTIRITAIASEADDPILLTSNHPAVRKALRTMQAQVISLEPGKQILPINTETDERAAWSTVISRAKRKP